MYPSRTREAWSISNSLRLDTGTLSLFYKGDAAHAGFDNVTFTSKSAPGAVFPASWACPARNCRGADPSSRAGID